MNILYTLNSGKPGGMEQHVLDLVEGMVGRGHTVYVWCAPGEISDWYRSAGAIVTEKKFSFEIDTTYIKSLVEYLKSNKVDVVHGHELTASANTLIAGYIAHTPVRIGHVHTPLSEWKHPNFAKKLIGKIQTFAYAMEVNLLADYEMVLTESRKRVKRKEGILSKKLYVVPNGLDLARFDATEEEAQEYREYISSKYAIPTNRFVFGMVSRMTAEKGHIYLLRAYKHFLDKYVPVGMSSEDFHLLLAGGGLLEEELQARVVELGLVDNVTITGIFEADDLPKFYRVIDAFVFPSLAEGFGYVLIEAMYTGVPTICSDLEVLREVADNTVDYFDVADSENMALKMGELYTKVESGAFDIAQMRERVMNRYSMTRFIAEYQRIYASLLKEAKKK